MGRVYLAYDPVLRRNVALKFVRGDDPELVHRFVSEAQAQARVEHERVCKVYEVGEVQGQPFIAMQYVEGRSLLDLIRELSLEQKVMVMQQVTEGVHAAHRAGLIHRDIKPTNILVERGEDGRWKPYVMDFGLARDWQREATVTGTVLGTPHYMAPEQARGEVSQLDRRADVYSLGATLYVMLTGKTPIPGTNALEVLTNLATLEPRRCASTTRTCRRTWRRSSSSAWSASPRPGTTRRERWPRTWGASSTASRCRRAPWAPGTGCARRRASTGPAPRRHGLRGAGAGAPGAGAGGAHPARGLARPPCGAEPPARDPLRTPGPARQAEVLSPADLMAAFQACAQAADMAQSTPEVHGRLPRIDRL